MMESAVAQGRAGREDVLAHTDTCGRIAADRGFVRLAPGVTGPWYARMTVLATITCCLGGSANHSCHGLSINRETDAMGPASLLTAAWACGEALWANGR